MDKNKFISEKIGELITDSNFVASEYCDTKIFFKHNWKKILTVEIDEINSIKLYMIINHTHKFKFKQ